ncbi:MAG TPA: lytic transglycosylase domain-containing protein [Arenibaculum sp.]|nr:lytic transglycosylase domain-containing protein [Arenibaculum sp.]
MLGSVLALCASSWVPRAAALEPATEGTPAAYSAAATPIVIPERQTRLPGTPRLRELQLSWADAERYRRVFDLQRRGDWDSADAIIRLIRDDRLMGHVRHQRLMHPTAYRASYAELSDWLARYGDHPDADRVYRLALKRRGAAAQRPARPPPASGLVAGPLGSEGLDRAIDVAPRGRGGSAMAHERAEEAAGEAVRVIGAHLRAGDPRSAGEVVRMADHRNLLAPIEADAARAEIAAAHFYAGEHRDAYGLARTAAERSGDSLPLSHWIAGLSAWRLDRIDRAARHFEALALIEGASPWDVSAGAFWAARAHGRMKRPAERARWLERAAAYPRTFYGMIAQRAIGGATPFRFRVPALTAHHTRALREVPGALRAIALLQAGESARAERELRRFHPRGDGLLGQALVALVETAGLPALALRIGSSLATPEGGFYDAALYPVPPWRPALGFKVDRALLYALMRQESRFDHEANSHAGAKGLMQLMPATASYMADGPGADGPGADGPGVDGLGIEGGQPALYEPEVNIELGQRYVSHLLDQPGIGGDLLLMMAAYNAGPGNLQRWRKRIGPVDDPLLFLESLPSRQTRNFVEQVLTNLWIYRQRLDQSDPSLDAIAAGRRPVYIPMDIPPVDIPPVDTPMDAAATWIAEDAQD